MPTLKDPPFGLGAPLKPFRLPEPLTGRLIGPEDLPDARILLVTFIRNACPDVQHLAGELAAIARDLDPFGLRVLAVNSDASDAPEEAPAAIAAEALRHGYVFPYLIDQTQAVARAYQVTCTPDFFLFGRNRRLAYHGRFDETRFGGGRPAHGADLRLAILHALERGPPLAHQVAAVGCRLQTSIDAPFAASEARLAP